MNLFSKLGNAMLNRLAPETSATAGWSACTSCGEYLARYQSKCVGATLYARCCHSNGDCSQWFNCGPQCA
ncbi:hypothetical protein [Streptomyces sp. NPDC058718]|uniref:hypothetical protein n=1 Tax=Streptomyces sp. NPDC058718 TaxID=3346610 RepID=UPI00367EC7B5